MGNKRGREAGLSRPASLSPTGQLVLLDWLTYLHRMGRKALCCSRSEGRLTLTGPCKTPTPLASISSSQ
jgi:hypothetical protein